MAVTNSGISRQLDELADLLEIEGENPFKIRAYRNAARTVSTLSRNVADMVTEGQDLTQLEGIGASIATKIKDIVTTGELRQLAEAKQRTPPELAEMLNISGLGPKRVQALYRQLGVTTLDELEQAAQQHRVREIEGFGAKIEEQILESLEKARSTEKRTRLDVAEEVVGPLVAYLSQVPGVDKVTVAGSYRRRRETVGDLDIVATGDDGKTIMERFVAYEDVQTVLSKGETRSSVVLRAGLQVDLRVVAPQSYGAALLYFTGSKAHNIALRNLAIDQGLKINEYGVFRGDERVAGETEDEIYGLFDLPVIVPELREQRGEIRAAREGRLPHLITVDDIRGDLQTHTTASDGRNTLEEMAQAARERGYEYLAVTDHSPRVAVTQGLDAEALARRIDEIDRLNDAFEGFRVLKGIEVDILPDGTLDLPDDVLSRLDVVVAAVHSGFNLSREKQTERIIRAFDNPNVHILAHPTGRLLEERAPYEVDMDRLIEAALERGCYLELNASPVRLDVDDVAAKAAKESGLKLAISTDAHRIAELDYMRFGIDQGRRGWLEPDDVLNTRSWTELRKLLQR